MIFRRDFIAGLGSLIACPDELNTALPGAANACVLFVSGQSNAVGDSENAASLPPELRQRSGAMIWTGRGWEELVNGANNGKLSSNGAKWGCEAEFARRWALEQKQRLFIVKHAIGGTALANYWRPRAGAGYVTMTRNARSAIAALSNSGLRARFVGLLWMQGESDCGEEALARAYRANLAAFFASVRVDWGSRGMPIVAGRVADQKLWTHRTVVRAAQADVVAADGNAALIDTDSYGNDGVHYTTSGIVRMGADMYEAWKTLSCPA